MERILGLLNPMAVLVVASYIVGRFNIYEDIENKKLSKKEIGIIVILFGVLSIYGTIFGVKILDTTANIRDLGPAMAGFLAGPLVGVSAGLIGGIHRFFMGGVTQVPCTVATILVGLIAGLISKYRKGKLISIQFAVIFMGCYELFHMGLVLLYNNYFGDWLEAKRIVEEAWAPMVLSNGLGLGLMVFFVNSILEERRNRSEKAKYENELHIGRTIQESLLPHTFPPFPHNQEFDLIADNVPAKEVAGDFYDFFLIDDMKLAFLIADVSGKGVSAGLFMAVTRTLIKTVSLDLKNSAEIVTKANNVLSQDNDACMFTTLFFGIYDMRTGEIQFTNAGHNPPFILKANGEIKILDCSKGVAMGVMENFEYPYENLQMNIGDTLFLYTDGITEATSPDEEIYGEQRLVSFLQGKQSLSIKSIMEEVEEEVNKFQQDNQFDDITMFLLRRNK